MTTSGVEDPISNKEDPMRKGKAAASKCRFFRNGISGAEYNTFVLFLGVLAHEG